MPTLTLRSHDSLIEHLEGLIAPHGRAGAIALRAMPDDDDELDEELDEEIEGDLDDDEPIEDDDDIDDEEMEDAR